MREDKRFLLNLMKSNGVLKSLLAIHAFEKVAREDFVLPEYKKRAYDDIPLPIMAGQTISQPSTVAIMTELLGVREGHKIFEVGTGSGYQAAILSEIIGKSGKVITTEIVPEVFEFGKKNIEKYRNVEAIFLDGSKGHEKEAPYDRIIITAAAPEIPEILKKQLKVGGKMVAPVGAGLMQKMTLIERVSEKEYKTTYHGAFMFVPMRGDDEKV